MWPTHFLNCTLAYFAARTIVGSSMSYGVMPTCKEISWRSFQYNFHTSTKSGWGECIEEQPSMGFSWLDARWATSKYKYTDRNIIFMCDQIFKSYLDNIPPNNSLLIGVLAFTGLSFPSQISTSQSWYTSVYWSRKEPLKLYGSIRA